MNKDILQQPIQGEKKILKSTCPMDKCGSGFTCPNPKSSCPWMQSYIQALMHDNGYESE